MLPRALPLMHLDAGGAPPPRAAGHRRDAAPRGPRGAALRDPDDGGHQARDVHAARHDAARGADQRDAGAAVGGEFGVCVVY